MSDTPGASVSAVENPHTDDITKAWSAVDAAQERFDDNADEVDRVKSKVKRAEADVTSAKDALADARVAQAARKEAIDAAKVELAAAEKVDPELAATVRARRKVASDKSVAELEDRLARMKQRGN